VIGVEVPDDAIRVMAAKHLPAGWRDQPSSTGARRLGGEWLAKKGELALDLPSVIVPQERTLLLNPRHPAAARLKGSKAERFVFDPRL
jgi:RES domain-containing protein